MELDAYLRNSTYYGCGKTLKKSCELGIRYVNNAIKTSPNFGKGNGPINHLNSFIIERNLDEKCSCCRLTVGR